MNVKNNKGSSTIKIILAVIITSIAAVTLYTMFQPNISKLKVFDSIGGDFELPSTLGMPGKISDHLGKVIMVNFGYTSCPDICPMMLTRMSRITKKLNKDEGYDNTQLQTLFISIDPDRDNIKHLTEYLKFFNPNIIGFTGSKEELKTVFHQFGIYTKRDTPKENSAAESDSYTFTHNDRIYLLDKLGRVRKLIGTYVSDESIMVDIIDLVEEDL